MSELTLEQATETMEKAIRAAGDELHKRPLVAEIILRQLLRCDPEHLEGLQLMGLCKHRLGENAEAVEIIQTALELDPDNADNWNNLGLAYAGLGEHVRALDSIKKAIVLNPRQSLFKNNLALQHRLLGDHAAAIAVLEAAVLEEPRPQLWLNLGGIYGEVRDMDNSLRCFEAALAIDPEYPAAYVDLSFTYHLTGKWKNGFAAYEWRFWYYPQMQFYLNAYDMSKVWDGKACLSGKRVLVYGEQGLGDTIQFARYCADLKARGAYVIVHCAESLDALVRRIPGVDETTNRDIVASKGPPLPEYDYQFAMMSFPHLLDIASISGVPYITPVTNKFRETMEESYPSVFKIGVVWAGSPAHPHDKRRSVHLREFRGIHDMAGVKLFSLQLETRKRQYGVTYRQVGTDALDPLQKKFHKEEGLVDFQEGCSDMKMVDLTSMIKNFDDTCTVLSGLDLLICCDTAVAHLAGAMGVPVWVLVPYNPDWRWGLTGSSTHWYDSMRLFRQTERGDWGSVLKEVEVSLAALLSNQ